MVKHAFKLWSEWLRLYSVYHHIHQRPSALRLNENCRSRFSNLAISHLFHQSAVFFAVHFFGWDACVVLQNMVMISGCICIWKAWHFDLNWVISCFLLRSLHAPDFPAIFKVWQVIVRPFSWAVTLLWTRKLILLLAKWNNALVNIVGVNCIQIGHVHKIHSRLFSASHECAQPLSCSD